MSFHQRTSEASKGKWRGILLSLGVPATSLQDRHGPCPICGGTDRFRWDNKDGSGSFICNQCGAGHGMELAMRFTGKDFASVASEIDALLGNVARDAPSRPPMGPAEQMALLRKTAAATVKITPGDLVDRYLTSRHIGEMHYPPCLRFAASLQDGEGCVRPAMVATIKAHDGSNASLHRTFLRPDGLAKAEMVEPRKTVKGVALPDGCAVRLAEPVDGGPLGVAEGIETAMSASAYFDMPVWSVLNAGNMEKWSPPDGVTEVVVFGDNDLKFAGQAAAYRLARRLANRDDLQVTVRIPPEVGTDWADVWTAHCLAKPRSQP